MPGQPPSALYLPYPSENPQTPAEPLLKPGRSPAGQGSAGCKLSSAAPDDIPYGSVMVLDHPVNGSNEYKIVDTGGAIRWVDSETCRIDIFVPEAKCVKDITSKYTNKIVTGKIYYKQ